MSKTLFLKDSVLFISIDGKEYEVDNPKQCGHWVEGEYETTWETLPLPCEWPGGVELIEREVPTGGSGSTSYPIFETVARLLPKEKKEPTNYSNDPVLIKYEYSEPQEPTPLHDLQTVMNAPVESQEEQNTVEGWISLELQAPKPMPNFTLTRLTP